MRLPSTAPFAAPAAAITSAAITLVACTSATAGQTIDLRAAPPTAAASDTAWRQADTIRLAVAPVYSPGATLAMYRTLADYIGNELDRPAELVQGKTYDEINDLIRAGEVTLAVVCTNAFLEGQEDFGLEVLVVPEINGETVYRSFLIVPADSSARSLADLRGGTFAFSDPLSNSGRLVPVYYLKRMHETPESFFRRTIFTYSHDNSVRAVAEGLVDAAAVDSLVYDRMDTAGRTRIITRWGPYGINPIVVHPRLDLELKSRLRRILLDLDTTTEGRRILKAVGVDRFLPSDAADYESVRAMRAAVRQRP